MSATGPLAARADAAALTSVDLSTYVRVGRYDLPEPTRTAAPANSLLAQEASSVTYDWDTDTLFVIGDGGTSVVQVSKTGQLLNSMTLPPGSSPQGTEFYDTEGITYLGGGEFVFTEERDRRVNRFTYVAGGTLQRSATSGIKLGTTIGNVGLEGVTNDPQTGGLVLVKEKTPESIFQTSVDWVAHTATNGSPASSGSTDLFDPALVGTADFSDVYALSNLSTLSGSQTGNLLVLSQESGKVVNIDRAGNVASSLTLQTDSADSLTIPDMTVEGLTMDNDGTLYVVSENGGGDVNHPQLWVYKPSSATNRAPTGLSLRNVVSSIPENTSTQGGIKVADITILDDGLGVNSLSLSGADASAFQTIGNALFIKAGTSLDYETKTTYNVTVNVDDASVGSTPDASVSYTLNVTDVVNETAASGTLVISEVAPWGSGSTGYAADWFEVTNIGGTSVDITGWKMDDNSYSFGSAVALRGISSISPGKSVIFIEGGASASAADATLNGKFSTAWFGSSTPPAGLAIGNYGGSGVGLSTGGDAVALFNSAGSRVTSVSFGASPTVAPFSTFDNFAGIGGTSTPAPTISNLAVVGTKGAFVGADAIEKGSPGVDYLAPTITEVPFPITVEATGATTVVSFASPTAADLIDGSRPVSCSPASGSAFAVGATTVTCSATDVAGNTGTATFLVTVRDTQPPVVNVPADITTTATGALTNVPFGPVTALDVVDGALTATCSPASPGPFPIGETHVDCFVTDAHGNRGAAPFFVTVQGTPTITISPSSTAYPGAASIGVHVADPTATGVPTGSVSLTVDSVARGSQTIDGSGNATFPVSGLSAGTHTVHADYSGEEFYVAATASATQTITQAASAVSVASSANPAVFGQSVSFVATVTDADSPAIGTVDFQDGGVSIGTAVLDGAGHATVSTSDLTVGDHPITVVYNGDANNAGATSAVLHEQVDRAATSTVLAHSPLAPTAGSVVTLTATVGVDAPGAGVPTGMVTFTDGATVLGSAAVLSSGVATLDVAIPASDVTAHAVVATYEGDGAFSPSVSAEDDYTGLPRTASISLGSMPTSSFYGAPVNLRATVTDSLGAVSGAVVTFSDGVAVLGTATTDVTGVATLSVNDLDVGGHTLTVQSAAMVADTSSAPQSASLSVTGNTLTLTAVRQTIVAGQSASIPVIAVGGHGATLSPNVSVSVTENNVAVGSSGAVAGGAGTIVVGPLTKLGIHTYKLTSTATPRWSSANVSTLVVVLQPTTVATTVTFANPGHRASTPVLLKATVKPTPVNANFGPFGGTVTFMVNGTPIGTVAVVSTSKAATAQLAVPAGLGSSACSGVFKTCKDTVIAVYSGDVYHAGSTVTKTVVVKP